MNLLDEENNWCNWSTSGNLIRPGAFSLTWVEADSQDMERMGDYGRRTARR